MLVHLDHTDQLASDIIMFWFKPSRNINHTAGQFIELFLPHETVDKRGTKRWFTLSSSPTEDLLAITTRIAKENGSSFKTKLISLRPGDELDMSGPMGDFTLPKDTTKKLIFIAGGIGITPMRSMVKCLADNNDKRDITLLHAVNTEKDLIFKQLFAQYGLSYIPVIKNPEKEWTGESGVVDAEKVLSLTGDIGDSLIFLSGPEPMTGALAKGLRAAGVSKKSLVTDYFPGYTGI